MNTKERDRPMVVRDDLYGELRASSHQRFDHLSIGQDEREDLNRFPAGAAAPHPWGAGLENAGMENAGMENAGMENAGLENAGLEND